MTNKIQKRSIIYFSFPWRNFLEVKVAWERENLTANIGLQIFQFKMHGKLIASQRHIQSFCLGGGVKTHQILFICVYFYVFTSRLKILDGGGLTR